jgi:hypothetical protein
MVEMSYYDETWFVFVSTRRSTQKQILKGTGEAGPWNFNDEKICIGIIHGETP